MSIEMSTFSSTSSPLMETSTKDNVFTTKEKTTTSSTERETSPTSGDRVTSSIVTTQGGGHVDTSTQTTSSTSKVTSQTDTTQAPSTASVTTSTTETTRDVRPTSVAETAAVTMETTSEKGITTTTVGMTTKSHTTVAAKDTTIGEVIDNVTTQGMTSSQVVTTSSSTVQKTHKVTTDMTSSPGVTTEAVAHVTTTETVTMETTPEITTRRFTGTPSTPCNRTEPCFPGRRIGDPEDCSKYYECSSGSRVWQTRSCGNLFFDMHEKMCLENATCVPPCDVTTTSLPTPTSTTTQPGSIEDHRITIESPDALEGEELKSLCSFRVGRVDLRPTVVWYLNTSRIRPSERIHITGLGSRPRLPIYRSTLTFDPVHAQDTGTLTCYVQLESGVDSAKSLQMNVLAVPTTTLTPMTATVPRGDDVTLTCTATIRQTGHPNERHPPLINWYRNGVLISVNDTEDIINSPGRSQLTTYPENDVTYSCAGYNANVTQGEGAWSNSSVYVIEPDEPVCEAETIDDVTWSRTAVGNVNVQPCPDDMIGHATRACVADSQNDAEWEEPNLIDCVNHEFVEISQEISRLEDGIGGSEQSEKITKELQNITNQTTPLPPGDINSATDSVASLAEIRQDVAETMVSVDLSEQEMSSMINTISNLLNEMNEDPWNTVLEEYPDKAVDLMWAVDTYGDIFAHQLAVNETMNIVTSMLVVQVDALSKEATRDLHYPQTDGWEDDESRHDSILLHKETLDEIAQNIEGKKISVSSSYYKNIDKILPNKYNSSDDKAYLNSRVLACGVGGRRNTNLDPPVQMSFTHDNIPDDKEASCVYWDYEYNVWSPNGCRVVKANTSQTTCECDHLTNFAILVSKKPVTGKHAYVLSIISIVGCVISIAGLFLTILVYISIWKHVKSHHAVVLINLCIALLIANLVFVTGVDKSANEDICTAIAALLHYFYLAAFCIMMVEGIQLLLYIIYVFHVRRKRETTLMLVMAWVVPAVVVGICLGISKTEGYGTEDYCWLDPDSWLFWAFIVPVILIIIINVGILVAVLKRISASKLHQADKTTNQRIRSAAWNIVVIMPILGITWIFGVFSVNSDIVAFQYIFAIANSLQGLFIFIFHAICNKKKGNYQVKTNSQRTQRSRLKSDSSGKNSNKSLHKIKKGLLGKPKKKRNKSTENAYDTIPAEYVMDPVPNNGKLAVENEYTVPDENNQRLSCFDTFMLPDEIKSDTSDPFKRTNGINHNPFDTYIVPEENRNNNYPHYEVPDDVKRESVDDTYMVPVSKQNMVPETKPEITNGFTNPAYIEEQADLGAHNRHAQDTSFNSHKAKQDTSFNNPKTMQDTSFNNPNTMQDTSFNNHRTIQDTSLTTPRNNGALQYNTPSQYHQSLQRTTSPCSGGLQNSPPSYHGSLHRELRHTDSGSSGSSLIPRDSRKMNQMRPDEVIDVNLNKQPSPRHTPRSSPRLPRSTPFLAKHSPSSLK